MTEIVANELAADDGHEITYFVSPESTRMDLLRGTLPQDTPRATMTEEEAIVELHDFFSEAVTTLTDDPETQHQALFTQQNLSVLRTEALDTAATGFAALWKDFLDQDRRHRIVVPTRLLDDANRKSNDYVYAKVAGKLTEMGGEEYASRISNDLDDIRRLSRKAFTKMVLLDDYSISGTQLRSTHSRITEHPRFSKAHVETHLVAATEAQLASPRLVGDQMPTYAYFKASQSNHRDGPLITGTHSSVDFGVVDVITQIATHLDPSGTRPLPALANIVKPY